MILYLTTQNVLDQLATIYGPPEVRDMGLLESAVARPQAAFGGEDAYPTLHEKAAALLHSLAKNHALVDGNKRAALLATKAMFDINGWEVVGDDAHIYQLVMDVAEGIATDVPKIAEQLMTVTRRRELPDDLLA